MFAISLCIIKVTLSTLYIIHLFFFSPKSSIFSNLLYFVLTFLNKIVNILDPKLKKKKKDCLAQCSTLSYPCRQWQCTKSVCRNKTASIKRHDFEGLYQPTGLCYTVIQSKPPINFAGVNNRKKALRSNKRTTDNPSVT